MAINTLIPWVTKPLLENDRLNVYEFAAKPGEKTEMHQHPDYLVYPLTDSLIRFTFEGGRTEEVRFRIGEPRFRSGHAHIVENIGDEEARVLVIDLKK